MARGDRRRGSTRRRAGAATSGRAWRRARVSLSIAACGFPSLISARASASTAVGSPVLGGVRDACGPGHQRGRPMTSCDDGRDESREMHVIPAGRRRSRPPLPSFIVMIAIDAEVRPRLFESVRPADLNAFDRAPHRQARSARGDRSASSSCRRRALPAPARRQPVTSRTRAPMALRFDCVPTSFSPASARSPADRAGTDPARRARC